MKHLLLLWMMCWVCGPAIVQAARKRVITYPSFVTASSTRIVIHRIRLSEEQTEVNASIYGLPGSPIAISARTCLTAGHQSFRLREIEGIDTVSLTPIPAAGYQTVTLSFPPLPAEIRAVDFMEPSHRWYIWGLQLTEHEPYVFVPSFLETRSLSHEGVLPPPALSPGKAILNGYVLGYDPLIPLELQVEANDFLGQTTLRKKVRLRADGSFHLEIFLPAVTFARITLNVGKINCLLQPGEETTVYLHLPRLSRAAFPMLPRPVTPTPSAWFDGYASEINTELSTPGSLTLTDDSLTDADEPTAHDCQDLLHQYHRFQRRITRSHDLSEGAKLLLQVNREMEIWQCSPESFKQTDLPLLNTPLALYAADYTRLYQNRLNGKSDIGWLPADVKELRQATQLLRLMQHGKTSMTDLRHRYEVLQSPPLRRYIQFQADRMMTQMQPREEETQVTILSIPEWLKGERVFPAITEQLQGKPALIDCWATWCGPCKKSFTAIRPLFRQWDSTRLHHVYITGDTSPLPDWEKAIATLGGIHIRLTREQWEALCRQWDITGIPFYLLLDADGKVTYRHLGFPGVDELHREILKVTE